MRYYENFNLGKLPNERWVPCIGYEDYYEVSNKGRVKSLPRLINAGSGRTRVTEPKILKQVLKKENGRVVSCRIQLNKEGNVKMHEVARLIFFSFNPNLEEYENSEVRIIKKNKRIWDCRLRNLLKGDRSLSRRLDTKYSEAMQKHLKNKNFWRNLQKLSVKARLKKKSKKQPQD